MKHPKPKICVICHKEFFSENHKNAQEYCNDCKEKCIKQLYEWESERYKPKEYCMICGKPMHSKENARGLRKGACSDECFRLLTNLYSAKRRMVYYPVTNTPRKRTKKPKAEPQRPGNISRIGEIEKAAREAGMSYGMYMAKMRGKRT